MASRRWLVAAGSVVVVTAGLKAADRLAIGRYGRPPRRHTSIDPGAVPEGAVDVRLCAVDGTSLRGWWRACALAPSGAAAIVIHGWGGSATDMIPVSDVLLSLGVHVLLLDARGHGRSDDGAVASMPAFADDVRVALDWLREVPQIDPTRIVLVGHSVGAGACLFVASTDPDVAAVVSLASMADPSSFMAQRLRLRVPEPVARVALRYVEHTIGHRFTEFSPIYTIGRVRAPVLLMHGRLDTTVPVADAYRLHARAPAASTLLVLPDGDHFNLEAVESVVPDLARFLEDAGKTGTGISAGQPG